MDKPQRQAAKYLGYNRISWDTGEGAPGFDDTSWADLTFEEQGNATVIGYAEESWDNPSAYCYDWVYLSDELKNAANSLGFGLNSWSFTCS